MKRVVLFALLIAGPKCLHAQAPETFDQLPGYERFREMSGKLRQIGTDGQVSGTTWSDDGKSLIFARQGKYYRVDLAKKEMSETTAPEASGRRGGRFGRGRFRGGVPRATQRAREPSPDGKWIAVYRDHNVALDPVTPETDDGGGETDDGGGETDDGGGAGDDRKPIQVTSGGTEWYRYGTSSWVYGEELSQQTAMWWSPDSKKLAYYETDERHLKEYYLTTGNSDLYTGVQTVRYPKAGDDNPYAGLLIYDLESGRTTRVNVGGDMTQYVYDIRFSPDGSKLLFHRTNRHQNVMEIMAADPETGEATLVVREEQPAWQENSPLMRFLSDGERFIWETERNGWRHYELRHLDGRRLNPLSKVAEYPCASIIEVDEEAGYFYYTAYSGKHPLNAHLHRVGMDGTGHQQLTKKMLNHSSFSISPDHQWFVVRYEAVDTPPATSLYNAAGQEVMVLAESDRSQVETLNLSSAELFTFKAADGKTDLYGVLNKPANFDPQRKYPLVISVYGGPGSRAASNRYTAGNPYCEFGFLVASIANRGTSGRGKAFETAGYMKLGIVDIEDQAVGARHLAQRSYVDETRVGIYGHSYGGYMSALALVKFPGVFHVGVSGSPVTDWRNYDTIYTERYMRTPAENADGYRDGSCLTYAKNLKGKLLLLHGLLDDNVHPSNTWQLIDALHRANKRFDLMIYPGSKHGLGGTYSSIRWEYLHKHLRPEPIVPETGE